jgi:hypothetical protein
VATVLVHELTHAAQVRILGENGSRNCVHMEVEAFRNQSDVWSALWEADPPGRTRLERELTSILRTIATEGEPGLYKLVVDTTDYQRECELLMPDPSGQLATGRRPSAVIGAPPAATPAPPPPQPAPAPAPAPPPSGAGMTADLAGRCSSLATTLGNEAAPRGGRSAADTSATVNAQCRDIAGKYGKGGVDCYEPAARDFWRNGASVTLGERTQSAEVANAAFLGRVAQCLKGLRP